VPANGLGKVASLAVRLFLPNTTNFNSVWSITKLRLPLSCTSIAATTTLGNYRLNFYSDNGAVVPTSDAGFAALQLDLLLAANPNSLLPLPSQLVCRVAVVGWQGDASDGKEVYCPPPPPVSTLHAAILRRLCESVPSSDTNCAVVRDR
jgi:hypothetical protein